MYLNNSGTSSYYYCGEQRCRRGWFLILCQPAGLPIKSEMRAFVRKVALHQLGQWMMGKAQIHGKVFSLSGAYGGDGLPIDVPQEIYDKGTPVPPHLYELWENGGGWNSCGSEREEMLKWAENLIPGGRKK